MIRQASNDIEQEEKLSKLFEKTFISYKFSDVRKAVPKVNFRKIRLSKFQDLSNKFLKKDITRIILDDSLKRINFPIIRPHKEKSEDIKFKNPLRRKLAKEEESILPLVFKEASQEPEDDEDIKELQEEEEKDVTFKLEAQIVEQEEPVILSPAIVSLPPLKEDILSSSGKQTAFVWPKVTSISKNQKKVSKLAQKKQKSKTKVKKKPYFIKSEEKKIEPEIKPVKSSESSIFKIKEDKPAFPWVKEKEDYESFENVIQGDLESSLTDVPVHEIESSPFAPPPLNKDILNQVIFKAIQPMFTDKANLDETDENFLKLANKFDSAVEVKEQGEVKQMSGKFERVKFTPIKIIILGGFVVTLGYLVYGYFFSSSRFDFNSDQNNKLVVRDLFKNKHEYKENINLNKQDTDMGESLKQEQTKAIKPITEQERLSLIQRAKEAIENRLDPFGQEAVLPQSVIEQAKQEEKAKPEIQLTRKQVELVGVISAKNNDLALLNIYIADYSVGPDDEKEMRENKLKSALTMAVPNRFELSVLDPVEGWYVKQIQRAKSSQKAGPRKGFLFFAEILSRPLKPQKKSLFQNCQEEKRTIGVCLKPGVSGPEDTG